MKISILKSVLFLLPFAFFLSTVVAQESLNATGGNASGSGGSASYSVGQVVYQTYSGTNGSVAEGVQQAFEISIVLEIEEAQDISLLISAYPNPASDYLTLEIQNFDFSSLTFQLYDTNGKLLLSEKIVDNQTSIAMINFVPATYFLKVIQGKKEVKTFKIVKS